VKNPLLPLNCNIITANPAYRAGKTAQKVEHIRPKPTFPHYFGRPPPLPSIPSARFSAISHIIPVSLVLSKNATAWSGQGFPERVFSEQPLLPFEISHNANGWSPWLLSDEFVSEPPKKRLYEVPGRLLATLNKANVKTPKFRMLSSILHNHSATGNKLIAWRNTGSTLVYTSFVSCGLECSSSLWVTAVDTPRCASREANVFLRSWNLRLGNPILLRIFAHFFGENLSANNNSCPSGSVAT